MSFQIYFCVNGCKPTAVIRQQIHTVVVKLGEVVTENHKILPRKSGSLFPHSFLNRFADLSVS